MKNILPIVILTVAVLGCDISKFTDGGKSNDSGTPKPSPSADTKSSPDSAPPPPPPKQAPAKPTIFSTLKKSAGKYPNDIKLIENAEMQGRLKKLMGADFSAMKSHWNVETPIEVDKDIAFAMACEAHNCGSNTYFMYVDVEGDNINVYHAEDGKTKTYFEKGKIALPAALAAKMDEN